MKEIVDLEGMGYTFELIGEAIHYSYHGDGLDPAIACPLINRLREKKFDGISFLKARNKPQLPIILVIEDIPEFLKKYNLKVVDFSWPEGERPNLIVEYG